MPSTIQLITYWRDLAIIELPFLDKDKSPSIGDALLWSNGNTTASSYRISLAILPYTDIIYPLLSLLSLQTDTPDSVHPSSQKVSLATFDVDPEGVPLPVTASLHIALAAVKAYEIEGNLQKLHDYHKKAMDAFRKKIDTGKPIDRDRLDFIIDWLQTFLPRGCAFTHEIAVSPNATAQSPSAPTQFTLPQNPHNIRGALHGYVHFLLGIKRVAQSRQTFNPTANSPIAAWPTGAFSTFSDLLKAELVRLKREIRESTCTFWPLPAHEEKERTQIVLEITAQYLAGYTGKLPHLRHNWENDTEKLAHQAISGQMTGIVVFSADTKWLHKLERMVTLSPVDHRDPWLEYPLATFTPQAARPLLDALARHEPHDTPYGESVFAMAMDSADQINRQLRLRNRLLRALKILRNQLEESVNEQPAIEAKLAALDEPEIPHKLVLAHRQIRRLEREIIDLGRQLEKLEKKRTRLKQASVAVSFDEAESLVIAMAGIKQTIKQKKQEIAEHEGRFGDIVAQHDRDRETSKEMLTDSLPQQVIGYHLKELARCFSNDILEQYRCLSIKSPEDVRAIIERLTMDNFEIGKSWPAPSARAIRGFIARTHSAYRKLLVEYDHLAGQLSHTAEEKKRLLALHKHLFMLYPVRLVPFDRGAPYLSELDGGKLQVAIVDATIPPHHLLLAHICERFNKVILLDGKQEPVTSTAVPQPLREILRSAHKLTKIPSYL